MWKSFKSGEVLAFENIWHESQAQPAYMSSDNKIEKQKLPKIKNPKQKQKHLKKQKQYQNK